MRFRVFMESAGVTMQDVARFLDADSPSVLMDWLQDSGDADFQELADLYHVMANDDPYAAGDLYKKYKKSFFVKHERDTNLISEVENKISRKIIRMIGNKFGGELEDTGYTNRLSFSFIDHDGWMHFQFQYPNVQIANSRVDPSTKETINWEEFLERYPNTNRVLAYIFVAELIFKESQTHNYGYTGPKNQRILLTTIAKLIGSVNYGLIDFDENLNKIRQSFIQAIRSKIDSNQLNRLLDWLQRNSQNSDITDDELIQIDQVIEELRNMMRSNT